MSTVGYKDKILKNIIDNREKVLYHTNKSSQDREVKIYD